MGKLHILETRPNMRSKTLCGLIGKSVYRVVDADCSACIERFKELYPDAWKDWQRVKAEKEKKIEQAD